MLEHVPYYLRNKYKENIESGINHICNLPRKTLSIDWQGNVFACICDGWLPITLGHITNFKNLESVWQSSVAQKLQKDVSDKKFTYCKVHLCDIKKQNIIHTRKSITINIDESCNLQCPSCRSEKINHTSGPAYIQKLKWAEHIFKLINDHEEELEINMSGNGDPFASLIYRKILLGLTPNNKHHYKISTNGLLLEKIIPQLKIINAIDCYNISIDAGDKETYERVRKGGKWEVLIHNLNFLRSLNSNARVNLNFCLQKDNLHSLKNFKDLVERYDWIGIVHPLENWYTWQDFDEQNVLEQSHLLHSETKEILGMVSQSKNIQLQGYIQSLT